MITQEQIVEFKDSGYIHLKNMISPEDVDVCKEICMFLKKRNEIELINSNEKPFGFGVHWKGIECASFLSDKLYEFYTSEMMHNLATKILDTDKVYLFNDQVVIKLPNEDFDFIEHTDNQYGPNNEQALNGKFKTITCCWVLDDFTSENGYIDILNKKTNQWETLLPKSGDIMIWDGNTLHRSGINKSNKERAVWLCVYSTTNMTKVPSIDNGDFSKFFSDEFLLGNLLPMTSMYKKKYIAQQTKNAWELFEKFLLQEKFERIIEIGTGLGGLTSFINDFSKDNNINTEIITFDVIKEKQNLIDEGINSIRIDVFDTNHTKKLNEFFITNKKILILCDGEQKPREFIHFSRYLKSGDFIMAHDYSISLNHFNENLNGKIWRWCQITEKDIENVSKEYNLVKYEKINFEDAMWVCKYKKDITKNKII